MLKIEEKEYDLNFLFEFNFNFQMLKEILFKLAKSQQDLESKFANFTKESKDVGEIISNNDNQLDVSNTQSKKDDSKFLKFEQNKLEQMIKGINERLKKNEDKIDELFAKDDDIPDNNNGNDEVKKSRFKILEEKLTKKIEIIEKKSENEKYEKRISDLETLIKKLSEDIESLKNENNNKNDIPTIDNKYDEQIKEMKELMEKNNNDLLAIIEEVSNKIKFNEMPVLKEEIKTNREEKNENFLKSEKKEGKTDNLEKNEEKQNEKPKENNFDEIKERTLMKRKMEELTETVKNLNSKVKSSEDLIKNYIKNQDKDFTNLKLKMEGIETKLDTKITKDYLKDLINNVDELSSKVKFLKDKNFEHDEIIEKLKASSSSALNQIESLTYDLQNLKKKFAEAQENSSNMDLSKYITDSKLKETLNPFKKNLEILFSEKDSLSKQVKEIKDDIKLFETKDNVYRFKEEINERISEIINRILKKYLEKIEFNKVIRSLEIQIKSLMNNSNNKESDTWILAKKPLVCFNCASCESNIKNIMPTSDYIPWNKYPHAERKYHAGQGFSRLLQKIHNDSLCKNYEKKDAFSDTEFNSNMNSTSNNINNIVLKINNRENTKEEFNGLNLRYNKRSKLPDVLSNKKKNYSNCEIGNVSRDENDVDNSNISSDNSPKIMKIKKKRLNATNSQLTINFPLKLNNENTKIYSDKKKLKFETIKSSPLNEN